MTDVEFIEQNGAAPAFSFERQEISLTHTPAHDWLLPRLLDLLEQAQAAGIPQDVAVAVITDLIKGPEFNSAGSDIGGQ
jgi:hypothetical protein